MRGLDGGVGLPAWSLGLGRRAGVSLLLGKGHLLVFWVRLNARFGYFAATLRHLSWSGAIVDVYPLAGQLGRLG